MRETSNKGRFIGAESVARCPRSGIIYQAVVLPRSRIKRLRGAALLAFHTHRARNRYRFAPGNLRNNQRIFPPPFRLYATILVLVTAAATRRLPPMDVKWATLSGLALCGIDDTDGNERDDSFRSVWRPIAVATPPFLLLHSASELADYSNSSIPPLFLLSWCRSRTPPPSIA